MGLSDEQTGLVLAVSSSLLIGTSMILTKKGLMQASAGGSVAGKERLYLKNKMWWIGFTCMVLGELFNFAAYAFAPAILVTPLGGLSVIVSAVLASMVLGETLGFDGKIGCALSLIGSFIIVIHAPPETEITSVNTMFSYLLGTGFIIYTIISLAIMMLLIYRIGPKYGNRTPIIYLTICALAGSLTVITSKAVGLALKLTFAGQNQLIYPSTYLFLIATGGSILVQMNYFNKALELFSTTLVTPIYYVFFTTACIVASIIFFQGIAESETTNSISIFLGFAVVFLGVLLINKRKGDRDEMSRRLSEGHPLGNLRNVSVIANGATVRTMRGSQTLFDQQNPHVLLPHHEASSPDDVVDFESRASVSP